MTLWPAWFSELRNRLTPVCLSPQQAHAEALWLAEHCLGLTASKVLLSPPLLKGEGATLLNTLLHQRITQRIPLQQLVGYGWFYGRRYKVSPHVLIPRPETEGLVELALAELAQRPSGQPLTVVDAGTGSGCILLSLMLASSSSSSSSSTSLREGVVWFGVDTSPEALAVARHNAEALLPDAGVCQWLQSDWLSKVPVPVDMLVSNPPYIPYAEADTLAPEVRDHEPASALFAGGDDGLAAAKALLCQTQGLAQGAWVGLELGDGQPPLLATWLAEAALGYTALQCHTDTAGVSRYLTARFAGVEG